MLENLPYHWLQGQLHRHVVVVNARLLDKMVDRSLQKKKRADSDRRSQKRKGEGGPAADSDPPASKMRGHNKKGNLISVAGKLQIIRRFQEFLKKAVAQEKN